jgi:hypothetical protein
LVFWLKLGGDPPSGAFRESEMFMLKDGERRRTAQLDFATGMAILGACGVGAWSLAGNRVLYDFDYGADPGPGLVPALLLAVLVLCAVVMIMIATVRLWIERGGAIIAAANRMNWKFLVLPTGMTASLLLYAWSVAQLGFLPSTMVFALLWCLLIGLQDNPRLTPRDLIVVAVEAFAISGGIYLVFVKLIEVQLP